MKCVCDFGGGGGILWLPVKISNGEPPQTKKETY